MNIEDLLKVAVSSGASDLHIQPYIQPELRVDGNLVSMKDFPVFSPEETKTILVNIMTESEKTIFEERLVIELGVKFDMIGNFRISVYHHSKGVAGVFRLIPKVVPTLDELSIPSSIRSLLVLPHGLILVAGPTGSGKSTTLAAMIDFINVNRGANIITIEDPIEYTFENKRSIVSQLQVGRDTHDFAIALKHTLRQDPNVIMLGELRDLETIRLAMTAAETGHLVLATIHASSAPLAVSRFADVFPIEEKTRARNLLSETLQAVLCQTLVKRVNGGRVAAFEVMLSTPSIRNYIRQDMTGHIESAMQTGLAKGMITLDQYLDILVKKGIINTGMATTVISNRNIVREALGKIE